MMRWLRSSPMMALPFTESEPLILRASSGIKLDAVYSIGDEILVFRRDGQWGQDSVIDPTTKAAASMPSVTRADPEEFRYR